jgi:hypothetical protein
VAPGPYHQYQMDLGFITDKQLPNQKYKMFYDNDRCVLVKYLTVIPLQNNKTQSIGTGILKSFELQGNSPAYSILVIVKVVYFNNDIKQMLDEANIQLITNNYTRTFR